MRLHKAASFRLVILLAVVAALVLPLTASGAKKLRIAMVLWRGETAAEKGFREGLKDPGYQVEYTVMNAGQDRGELGRLLRETSSRGSMVSTTCTSSALRRRSLPA